MIARAGTGWRRAAFAASLLLLYVAFATSPVASLVAATLLRPPLELAVLLGLALVLPERWFRAVRWIALAFLAVFLPLKLLDAGFFMAFDRPFEPVLDFYLLPAGWTLLSGSMGALRAGGVVLAIVLVLALVVIGVGFALKGLALPRGRRPDARIAAVLVLLLGVLSLVPMSNKVGRPGAPALTMAYEHALSSGENLKDAGAFKAALDNDPYKAIPDDRLLAALKGKDVVLVFVESYGRGALEEPRYARVQHRVDAVQADIAKAGFAAVSGWAASPTHGGQSWLAHETLLSGLWIDGAGRYNQLTRSGRATLIRDFRRAGWRTLAIMPAIAKTWLEGGFFGYDKIYGAHDLGYRGQPFGWMTMPDQFTFLAMKRAEFDRPNRPPLMAEVALISSHAPFTPVPRMVDWDRIGDGKVFDGMTAGQPSPDALWRDMDKVAEKYAESIDYSLASLGGYVRRYGDDRLVVIALGDHQPGGTLTRPGGPHQSPMHIIARDPKVLEAARSWGFTPGMRPDPKSRPLPMDQFAAG